MDEDDAAFVEDDETKGGHVTGRQEEEEDAEDAADKEMEEAEELRYCEQCYRMKPTSEFEVRPNKKKVGKKRYFPFPPPPKKTTKLCLNCRHNKVNAAKRLKEAKDNGAYETSFLTRSKRLITYHHAYIVTILHLTTTKDDDSIDYEGISKKCTANMKSLIYNQVVKEVHGRIRTSIFENEKKVYIEFGMHLVKFLSKDWFYNKLREINMEMFTPAECVGCLLEDFQKFKNGEDDKCKEPAKGEEPAKGDEPASPVREDGEDDEAATEQQDGEVAPAETKEYEHFIEQVTLPENKEKKRTQKVWNTMKIRHGPATIIAPLRPEKRFGILEKQQEKLSRAVIYLVRKYPGQVNMFASPKDIVFFFWFHRLCTHEEFLIIQEEAENPSEISDVEFWNRLPTFVMFMREIRTGVTLVTKKDIETYRKEKEKATVPDLRPMKNSYALKGFSDIIRKIEQPQNRIDKYLGPWRCAFCKHDYNIDTTHKTLNQMMNHIQLRHAIWNQDEKTVNFMDFTERMISSIGGGDSLGGWEMLWDKFKAERDREKKQIIDDDF